MPAVLTVPDLFRTSYIQHGEYPGNLLHQTAYRASIHAQKIRFDNAESRLFTKNNDEIEIPFRDFNDQGVATQNIFDDTKLVEWLGDMSRTDPLQPESLIGNIVTKKDPKCRFIFLFAGQSRRPLRLTKKMFSRILSYHQVMAGFLDFVSVFGSQSEPRDLRFSGFRDQTLLTASTTSINLDSLGRSGRQFQLCYNLKAVSLLDDHRHNQWSIRQAAIHHQFDIIQGTTLWIIIKGDLELKDRIKELTGTAGREADRSFQTPEQCFKSSLAMHLLYGHWSTENWRWYIQWLEGVIEKETKSAVQGRRDTFESHYYTPDELQTVQHYEDKINDAIMILEANTDVLGSIKKYYQRLLENPNFPLKTSCKGDIDEFATQLDDMIYDSRMQVLRAKVLVRITADRKSLILQHMQSQTSAKMEAMTVSMHKIGAMAQKEAIAMRIVTVVTLIFLPATFVSTFFSTDVVKYQGANMDEASSGGSFSSIALWRWLQVTIPLTIVTLCFGYAAFRIADKRRKEIATLPFHVPGFYNKEG